MAAPVIVTKHSVRIRIAEITLWGYEKIQPFWLLIHFDSSPLISNVEEKIVRVLNSLITTNHNVSLESHSCTAGKERSESETCRWPYQDPSESRSGSVSQKEHSRSKNFTKINIDLDLTENDDTAKDTDKYNFRCNDDDEETFKVVSCQLWMEGFLLLSSESSQIFQNGDLVTVKCAWIRCKTLTKESVTSAIAHRNVPAEVSSLRKRKKKKKHDGSLSVNENIDDSCKDVRSVNEMMIGSLESSDHVYNNSFQCSDDSAQKQKLKHKKSKNDACVIEKNMMSKSNIENCIDEQNVKCFENAGTRPQNDSGKELKGSPCQDTDLLLLMNEKIKELTENQIKSPLKIPSNLDLSENHKKNDDLEGCSSSKRKRRRKRKKKANDNAITEAQEKTPTSVKEKFLPLKLPGGGQLENTRLTFETDSESDGSSKLTYTQKEKEKALNINENVNASHSFASHQHKGDSEFMMEKFSGSRSESYLVTKKNSNTENIYHLKAKAPKFSKSYLSDFVHGQSVNPNSKFDELLQRRKLSGNNCSVGALHNGAYIFTRERQKEKNEYQQISQTTTGVLSSKERPVDLPESPSATKVEIMDTCHAPTVEVQQTSSLPTSPNLIEVTPVYLDIERCKPLDGLPQAGDIIAYKILEMSHDYTPALSKFKQGQVMTSEDGVIQIELSEGSAAKKRTGRFELVYEKEEEEDEVSCNNNYVSVEFADMVDVRLVQRCQQGAEKSC